MGRFYIGLDLGRRQEQTGLAIVERQEAEGPPVYQVRHLERFDIGTTYPAIVGRLAELLTSPPLVKNYVLLADATAVGLPVVRTLTAADLPTIAVTITAGNVVGDEQPRQLSVPRRDLVTNLQLLLQSGRLQVAEGLPEAAALVRELLGFRAKADPLAAQDSDVWREGAHDDLVLAVAMAVWFPEQRQRGWAR